MSKNKPDAKAAKDAISQNWVTREIKQKLPELLTPHKEHIRTRVVQHLLKLAQEGAKVKPVPSNGNPITGREFVTALIDLHQDKVIDLTALNIDEESYIRLGLEKAVGNHARDKRFRDAHREHVRPPHYDSGIRELRPSYAPSPRGHGYTRSDS